MNLANFDEYKLLDMSNGEKVENWNGIILRRPDPQVIWNKKSYPEVWKDVHAYYQFIKALIHEVPDLKIDKDNMMMVSPDEGGIHRNLYYSTLFGINLGIAFQLQDDIFDCYGDVKVFGKMTGGDISDNKKTYLYLKALELASEEDRNTLLQLFAMPKGRDEEKIQKVLNIYDKYNVRNIVTDLMTKYYEDSLKNLDEVNVPEDRKQVLRDYAAYLYTRNK